MSSRTLQSWVWLTFYRVSLKPLPTFARLWPETCCCASGTLFLWESAGTENAKLCKLGTLLTDKSIESALVVQRLAYGGWHVNRNIPGNVFECRGGAFRYIHIWFFPQLATSRARVILRDLALAVRSSWTFQMLLFFDLLQSVCKADFSTKFRGFYTFMTEMGVAFLFKEYAPQSMRSCMWDN